MPARSRVKKYERDRLVTVSPVMVRAIMQTDGVTVSELAREAKSNQQTISALISGDELKKCRRSRRSAMARALNVPDVWLSGEWHLPLGPSGGFEWGYSARTRLAVHRLTYKADLATHRDLDRLERRGAIVPEQYREIIRHYVDDYLGHLLKIGTWREMFLNWTEKRHPRQGYIEPRARSYENFHTEAETDPAHEAAILAFARALDHVLTPWFEDKATLNYSFLRDLVRTDPRGSLELRSNPIQAIPEDDIRKFGFAAMADLP